MSYWTDSAASLYPSAGASMGDDEVGFGTRFVEATAESARYTNLEEPTLLDDAKDWAAPLLQEWDTTKAAFIDAIHSKTATGLASTERSFQESKARDDSSLLQAYFGLSSGVASGFVNAVGGSFTGLPSLATSPIDTLQSAGHAAMASGVKYAMADAPEKVHMLASGITEFGVGAAMWGAGTIGDARPTAPHINDPAKTPELAQASSKATAPEWPDLAEFFGSAFAAEKPRLRRDLSHAMKPTPTGRLNYPDPDIVGLPGHGIMGQLTNGALTFSVRSIAGDAPKFGYADEMFAGLFRAYEKTGEAINSIEGSWNARGTFRTNYDEFMGNLDRNYTSKAAAANTFTGRQAAAFGYTDVEVLGNARDWQLYRVATTFKRPDWGMGPEWANYANAWVRAMGQR